VELADQSAKMLVVIPTEPEFHSFVATFGDRGLEAERSKVGNLPVVRFAALGVTVSLGGLGKVRFAVHTQHLLDSSRNVGVVICAGAVAGTQPSRWSADRPRFALSRTGSRLVIRGSWPVSPQRRDAARCTGRWRQGGEFLGCAERDG